MEVDDIVERSRNDSEKHTLADSVDSATPEVLVCKKQSKMVFFPPTKPYLAVTEFLHWYST